MRPRFINAVYVEGRILLFEEYGDVYEFSVHTRSWQLLAASPWPQKSPDNEPATLGRGEK
jgi:hypothetical protein